MTGPTVSVWLTRKLGVKQLAEMRPGFSVERLEGTIIARSSSLSSIPRASFPIRREMFEAYFGNDDSQSSSRRTKKAGGEAR